MRTRWLVPAALPSCLSMGLVCLGALTSACGGTVAAEPSTTTASAATRAPLAAGAQGRLKLIGEALGDVPLRASQRAEIEQLATEAQSRHAAAATAGRDLATALAAQVEAGQIDRAALQPKLDALAAAAAQAQPGDRAGFERLHAILEPDQRTAFVNALQARVHEVRDGAKGPGHMGRMGRMKEWADELGLSEEQRTEIRAAIRAKLEAAEQAHPGGHPGLEAEARGGKVLEAFKQDRFVLDEVAPARDAGRQAVRAAEWLLGMAEAAVPVLTPEQRKLAAGKLLARARGGEGGEPSLLP